MYCVVIFLYINPEFSISFRRYTVLVISIVNKHRRRRHPHPRIFSFNP